MKPLVLIFCLSAALACADESRKRDVAGAYYYDGMTQVINLALLPNGNYLAHWSLDIFPDNGSASGTWRLESDEVHLTPKKEEGALKGYLRVLLVRKLEDEWTLLRSEDVKFEGNPFFYFHPRKPNQSPEPTVMLVTPRAEPRVAPSTAVAHL